MDQQFEEFQKKRLLSSYFSVIVIISIVLFLFGVLGLSVISIKSVGNSFKEKLTVSIYLKDDIKNVEINQLKNSLTMSSYIKNIEFISKDEAAIFMEEEYGEDFIDDIGYNPLVNSIDINIKANYINNRTLDSISTKILEYKFVDDIIYDRDLISIMNKNLNKIAFWILPASIVFTLIAFLIINSSIRLSIFSKRHTIKTMQMVGATKDFIRRPFIIQNIKLSLISSIIASIGLAILIAYINQTVSIMEVLNISLLAILFVFIIILGVVISWLSTYFATQNILNLNTEKFNF
jgi:cell division transport system permease protein